MSTKKSKTKGSIVVYSSKEEVLVCTQGNKKKMLQEWFTEHHRNLEDYEVEEGTVAQVWGYSGHFCLP